MLPAEAKAITTTQILPAANCANTAEATSDWIAVPATEGCLVFTQAVGSITGTLAGALETAEASNGLNNVAMVPDDGNNFASVSAANNVQKKVVNARKNKGYVQYIGTVGTGPVVASVTVEGRPKTTT